MVEFDWRVDARAGVALVELTVTNPDRTARRVRVANRLDGPVWPPRREGVPAAGWDDGGFEGVVAPGERRALGYASPASAPVDEPPAEVVWTERAGASESEPADPEAVEATPAGVVRGLGDARPPADAVPRPEPEPTPPIPDAVEAWLAEFEDGATDPTDDEQAALRAVVRRARELCEESP